jgi:hypothetical protein
MEPGDAKNREALRLRLMGLGDSSLHKSYYPELQKRLGELERFRTLLDRANDAIFLVSLRDGCVRYANASARRYGLLLGAKDLQLQCLPLQNLLLGGNGEGVDMDRILAASAFDSGEEGRCVLDLFTDEGLRRCELSVSVPETSEDAHAVLILRDVEDRLAAEDRLRETLHQVEEARSRTVSLTAAIVELKDSFTGQHQRRTAQLASAIGRHLGVSGGELYDLVTAAMMHDMGLMAIPTDILFAPRPLSEVEWLLVHRHPLIGKTLMDRENFPSSVSVPLVQHHERLDGSGYPRGLSGRHIVSLARILAVADVAEAMSSHRPYRPAHGRSAVLAELASGRGGQFDAAVVDACAALLEEGFAFAPHPVEELSQG